MNKTRKYIGFVGIALLVFILFLVTRIESEENYNNIVNLIRPSIADASESGANFLNNEAGITAFIYMNENINLEGIRQNFNSIEKQTANYIIGSVTPEKYSPGSDDVHVYVSNKGWFVAWHNREAPASKIVDWKNYKLGDINTTLNNVMKTMVFFGTSKNISDDKIQMYDFSNPQANRMMIIADSNDFYITIPDGVILYRASGTIGDPEKNQTEYSFADVAANKLVGGRKQCSLHSSYYHSEIRIDNNETVLSKDHDYTSRTPHMAFVLVYKEPN